MGEALPPAPCGTYLAKVSAGVLLACALLLAARSWGAVVMLATDGLVLDGTVVLFTTLPGAPPSTYNMGENI